MKGDVRSFRVTRPRTLDEALQAMASEPRPLPIAGGTDLFVGLNDGKAKAEHYLDLSLVDEMRGIGRTRAGLTLGARTTYTDLRRSKDARRFALALDAVARDVGAIAIQNRGTIGGSLANASPASDPAPVLMALDARVELASVRGRRHVPLHEFFTAYRQTAANPDELITSVFLPAESSAGWTIGYRKVGTRRAQAISKVVLATALLVGKNRRVEGVRLAFGSVAATTVRARAAEALLLGEVLSPASIAAAQDALSRDIKPIDDIRSTGDYRMHVARNLLGAMLLAAVPRRRAA